ncbi:MAG: M3 family oligoendopeptidase [Treponema sp.]|jgi:pepF/M3 family oligoendopeptidase|nr:M3 family oligoendopeptidase [Treponema sp.]
MDIFKNTSDDASADALPSWNLEAIYPSFDSPEYKRDIALLEKRAALLLEALKSPPPFDVASAVSAIRAWEDAADTAETLMSYAEAVYTTDTRDSRALAEINAVAEARLPLGKATVILRNKLAEIEDWERLFRADKTLAPYRFFIAEAARKARFQMTPELEDLANDLARSGADAWQRLYEAVSSTAGGVFDGAGDGARKTVAQLRGMATNKDRLVREKAYKAEIDAWRSVEIPLAAALNGVKGAAITLDTRRNWRNAAGECQPLQKAAFQSRISEKTLASLIAALEHFLPLFRRYLSIKARALNIPVCAFYDLFAPVGEGRRWTFDEASKFIVNQFSAFDPAMGAFTQAAFDAHWIDAGIREGKVGGAYCAGFPLAGVSRILCNFDGSFDSVSTVAHELGHAWHHDVIKSLPRTRAIYPMTLAETASVFAETIVFEGAYAMAASNAEKLFLIEANLKDCCQVIVDILSRFYFEKALFERRAMAELSPEDLCALMIDAQKRTYGAGLDENLLHPYMWAVKSHYYSADMGFYNYPYAFGQLFSLGLYAAYSENKQGFAEKYKAMLALTGSATAEDVARSMGCDIEGADFWRKSLNILEKRVDEFEKRARNKDYALNELEEQYE